MPLAEPLVEKALRCANGSPSLLEQQDRAASHLTLNLNAHNEFFTIEIDCYITKASRCCATSNDLFN